MREPSRNTVSNGFTAASNGSTPQKSHISVNGHLNGTSQSLSNGTAKKPVARSAYYRGHNREELTRILIQGLKDMGYSSAADSLAYESGYELESPEIASFRRSILEGRWTEAERILLGSDSHPSEVDLEDSQSRGGVVLADGASKSQMLFWIRQQKFLELLVGRELLPALRVLREELTPLNHDVQQLHALSSLLMCTRKDLETQLKWPDDPQESRKLLLQDLTKSIAPSVMIRDHRLAELLDQVKQAQINSCLYHNTSIPPSLYADHTCNREDFPSRTWMILEEHTGEIYHVQFSPDGTKLATAGEDKVCIIYDVTSSFKVLHRLKEHEEFIIHVAWSPDSKKIITCSSESRARIWDVMSGKMIMRVEQNCTEKRPISGAVWTADSSSFVTCCHDPASPICLWSLSAPESEKLVHTWKNGFRVTDIAITADGRRLLCTDMSKTLYVYDMRTFNEEYRSTFTSQITSVTTSRNSSLALINLSEGEVHLMDVDQGYIVRKFKGQKQGTNIIRSCFGGAAENFVLSGSEDGRIYIWHKENCVLIEVLRGHGKGHRGHQCVTTVSWNPNNAGMFASGGDDGKVRIWTNTFTDETSMVFDPRIRHPDLGRTSAIRSTSNL